MNRAIGIPLSSEEIPVGTGLVQSIECTGIKSDSKEGCVPLFEEPVVAQITTFANGIRRVCCPKAKHMMNPGDVHCAKILGGTTCIYAWEDGEK